jgi:hypothetical protein
MGSHFIGFQSTPWGNEYEFFEADSNLATALFYEKRESSFFFFLISPNELAFQFRQFDIGS